MSSFLNLTPSRTTPSGHPSRTLAILLPLGCLLGLAFLLRTYRIGHDPVWFDEAATIGIAMLDFADLFGEMARLESSPPGYYVIAKLWGAAFGLEIVPLRLFSVTVGALAIVPLWLLARDIGGTRAAWLAAILLTLAASHVRLSQDARTYAVLSLVSSCALLLTMRLARRTTMDRGTAGCLLAVGAAQGTLLWLHATAPLIILGLNICLITTAWLGRMGFRHGIILVIAANLITGLIGLVPVVHAISHLMQPRFVDRWIQEPDILDTLGLYGRTLIAPFLHSLSPLAGLVYGALAVLATVIAMRYRNDRLLGLLAMLACIGLALPVISNIVPILLDRTILFMLTPLLVVIATATAMLPRPAFISMAAVLVAMQCLGVVNYQMMDVRKEQWPAVATALVGQIGPQSTIVVTEGAFAAIALDIPLQTLGQSARIVVAPPTAPMEQFVASRIAAIPLLDPTQLCTVIRDTRDVWVVTRSLPPSVANDPGYSSRNQIITALIRSDAEKSSEPDEIDNFLVEHWTEPRCNRPE
jgi:hypothetical protein